MRKTRKAARIVWEADRKRVNDRLGADVSLCSAFWSRLSFARSQRGFVAGCGMALKIETSPARRGAFLTISLYSYQGLDQFGSIFFQVSTGSEEGISHSQRMSQVDVCLGNRGYTIKMRLEYALLLDVRLSNSMRTGFLTVLANSLSDLIDGLTVPHAQTPL